MTCEEARIRMAEELGRGNSQELAMHLATCAACASEVASARSLWQKLGELPDPAPSPYLATRFYAALDAYQSAERQRSRSGFWNWWPAQTAWQVVISAACLIVGVFAGSVMTGRSDSMTTDELRKEIAGMRQLVTLSLLQQQSATDRLRGVNYSYRAEPNDTEVFSALMQTVNSDSNVNVRLAAVDALRQFRTAEARSGLVSSLRKQDSPMVQIAIIDALAELKEHSAAPAMRALLTEPEIDVNVRKRVESVLSDIQ